MSAATVCRLEAGAPRRDDAPLEKVARTPYTIRPYDGLATVSYYGIKVVGGIGPRWLRIEDRKGVADGRGL